VKRVDQRKKQKFGRLRPEGDEPAQEDLALVTDASKKPAESRIVGRPFAQGNPGGPGRPQGSRNAATILLDQLADGEASEILAKVVGKARDGDLKAAELILARVWPARKGRRVVVDLPRVETPQDVLLAISAVLETAASGDVTPDEAALLASLLDAKRKALETIAIEERLARLEKIKT
jgi:hypothetical protein